MQSTSDPAEVLPSIGTDIATGPHTFHLLEAIGDGGYGSVFLASDRENQRWAVKVEKFKRSMLHIEVHVLKAANAADCKHFCTMVAYGANKPFYTFIAMTLLGRDLHHLRSDQPSKKFSMATTLRVGQQTIKALEELHSCGFISRDFKPGNLAPGVGRQRKTIFLYDFGLARKYEDKYGNIVASRGEIGWRGTQRYGSLNAHLRLDLSRRDDVESWMYMMLEFMRGSLPWRMITDRADVHQSKMACRHGSGRQELFKGLPPQFDAMLALIDGWGFEIKPDYKKLRDSLTVVQNSYGLSGREKYDWDEEAYSNTTLTEKRQPSPTGPKDLVAIGTVEE